MSDFTIDNKNIEADEKQMALYLHIPFCKKPQRCIYCDFFSTTQGSEWRRKYTERLCQEIAERRDEALSRPLSSIYFGGGTPSQLSFNELQQIWEAIRKNYKILPNAEITIEVNPDDISREYVQNLRFLGFNRVSMGVQTFNDRLLQTIQRRHSSNQAKEAIQMLHDAGFQNLSIDLIHGLPGQTVEDFEEDLDTALQMPITHLSAYTLMVENGTKLHQMVENGELELPSEDVCLNMFEILCRKTRDNGFLQYEISNFSRPGFESRHNSSYWQGTPYIGVGAGAHSYDGKNIRRMNKPNLKAYIDAKDHVPHENEELNEKELYNEFIFTRLRTRKGLSLEQLYRKFSTQYTEDFKHTLTKHLREGNICKDDGDFVRLTHQGIMISNDVMSDFMAI